MTLWSKTITLLPATDIGAPEKFIKLDPFKLAGTGETRSAVLVLNGRDGAFVTNANSGATPILAEFQKIKISLTDKNGQTKSGVFMIDTIRPVKEANGINVVVQMFGQERWLQKMIMPHMRMRRISHYQAILNIIDIYNANKGTNVTIEKHDDATFNQAPKWTSLDFDFTDEPTYYEALMRVMNRMNTTVANRGAGDFFELYFADDPADTNKIQIKVFSSGSLPIPPSTVENTNVTRIYSANGTIEAKTGTLVIGEGENGIGSIPLDFAKFWGRLESFILHPVHVAGLTYPIGAKVQLNGTHYEANSQTSTTPPGAAWNVVKEADEIGLVPYSKYTYLKAVSVWKNSGSNPQPAIFGPETGFNKSGCWDGNLSVRDEDHYRTWVHLKSTTDNFSVFYKYGASAAGAYRGLRCLVNGIGTGAFAGHDNKIMMHDGLNWQEFGPINSNGIRAPQSGDVVAVRSENKNYIWNGSVWVDDSSSIRGNDCFHIIESITNQPGVSSVSKQKGDGTWLDLNGDSLPDTGETYGTNSAVKYTFVYTPFSTITSSIFTDPNYYSIGCWANLEIPIPANTLNGITESLGQLYGGTSVKKEPATFDFEGEFGLTPTGKSGWNQTDSEEQGPRDSINFMALFKWEYAVLGDLVSNQSNFKFRCLIYDTNDNVVFQDFEILDNGRWEQISLPLSGFKTYRARAPLKWGNVASNIILPDIEMLDRFFWKNAKMMCIQLQEVYDNAGRYSPEGSRFVASFATLGLLLRTSLWLDAVNFGGKLIATTGTNSTTNIEVIAQRPSTSNYEQLKQDVNAQKEIEQHKYDAWEIYGEGFCNRDFGEAIFLKDSKLINDTDDPGIPNTKKLVIKEMSIALNGTDGGQGGFTRKILGVKRI